MFNYSQYFKIPLSMEAFFLMKLPAIGKGMNEASI